MANANIFSQYLQPVRSVSDYAADLDKRDQSQIVLEGLRRQNALASLTYGQQVEQAQQARQKQNALQSILTNPSITDPVARENAMLSHPLLMQEGLAAQKQRLDNANTEAQTTERKATAAKSGFDVQEAKRKAAIQQVASLNTPQDAMALLQSKVQAGEFPPELVPMFSSLIQNDPKWQVKLMLGISDPTKMAELLTPHLVQVNNGKFTTFPDLNPLTNPNGPAPVAMTTTPGEDLSSQTSRANNAASVGATLRGQNITDARERAQMAQTAALANQGVTYQQDGNGNFVALPTKVLPGQMVRAQPVAAPGGGLQPLQGKPSEATQKELTNINQQRSIVQGAINAAQQTPGAFSFGRGSATAIGGAAETIAGRFDSDAERQARAYVFNNVSKVINERAGAAQSAQELARLRGFLPGEQDNAEQVVGKLKAFQTYLDDLESGTRKGMAPSTPAPAQKQNPARAFSIISVEK